MRALLLLFVALATLAAADLRPQRGDPTPRLSTAESASEYWDLVARFDGAYFLVARFLLTNMGPGIHTAAASGYLVRPDGSVTHFTNGRRRSEWRLQENGRRLKIGSSILDVRGPERYIEIDKDRKGVKIFLRMRASRTPSWRKSPATGAYRVDLVDLGAPIEGSVWVEGMDAPVDVRGFAALSHTYMDPDETDLALLRYDFASLEPGGAVALYDMRAPDGSHQRWLAVGGEEGILYETDDFETSARQAHPSWKEKGYPLPAALEIRGSGLRGTIELGRILASGDPLGVLPQPFRFLLSFKTRPRRVWTDSPFEMIIDAGPDGAALRMQGNGIGTVTFLNPLETPPPPPPRQNSGA